MSVSERLGKELNGRQMDDVEREGDECIGELGGNIQGKVKMKNWKWRARRLM